MEETGQADRVPAAAAPGAGGGEQAELALELGRRIRDHRGGDVAVLDLRELNIWTDFFVIATVSSSTHLQGLYRQIKDFALERELDILYRHRNVRADNEWSIVDMGTIVVHLLTARARSFYELERLWSSAKTLDL